MKENDNGTDTNVGSIGNSIEELKRLLYRNELSQCGKRKLINYYEQQEKDYKRVLKENEKINSLIKKLEKDSKEQQWIQTVDDEYVAYTEKAIYADELLSFFRGEE